MEKLWLLASSAILSMLVAVVSGKFLIPVLYRLKVGQRIRSDGPESHLKKTGTPTMGGVIFLLGIAVAGFLYSRSMPDGLLVVVVTVGFGLIGLLDDSLKVILKRPLGLRAREKLAGQVLFSVFLVTLAVYALGRGTGLLVPFGHLIAPEGLTLDLGLAALVFFDIFVMVSAANAVNLTDGLDGLAAGVTVIVSAAMAAVALWMDRTGVAVAMAAVAGGCLGFLVYNRHPAKVFMGDTGSLALGGAVGAAAVITGCELFLFIIGFVYVAETLSVILQVASFQLRGKRIFRMSPLHHHFELGGWSEKKVVNVFYVAALVFAATGLAGM